VISCWGQIDILVNNAGVTGAQGWIETNEDRDDDWMACIAVNLMGTMYCCKEVIPHMASRNYGKIINISSMSGRAVSERPDDALLGRPSHFPYAVTKAGVIRYTQKLAPLAAVHNINVNTVCPGSMLTDFGVDIVRRQQHIDDPRASGDPTEVRRQMVINSNLFGRELMPSDVAKMVAFLASDDAKNITGAAFHVDGGAVMV
jgi:NAD(P)-dependent dehydrogenase (short-subunit alcohol dehydrogenase family)